jgi:hypothetical protein
VKWLLLWFLGTTGVVIVALCIVVLFVRHRIARRHRIDPKVATAAPLHWLADPRPPARLHRRLAHVGRIAGQVADDHGPAKRRLRRASEPSPVAGLALDLQVHARRLDDELVRVALLAAPARREPLQRLAAATADLERAATQLAALSAEVRTPPVLASEAGDLVDLAGQVERLAAAHRALLALDEDNGLVAAPVTGPAPSPSTQAATSGRSSPRS